MIRAEVGDLIAFIAVARERSFTRAAAQLGVSQSALSHTIRTLETRMGLRLLTRTTRSVAPTEVGARLLASVGPHFDEIDSELAGLGELRDKPAGTIRITTTDYAADTILWPRLAKALPAYPEIKVEIVLDYGLTDIVAGRFDIGVRLGDQVDQDMIAVRIGPDIRFAIVGAPSYLKKNPPPRRPQDLLLHDCITLRLPTHGGVYCWELVKGRRSLQVRVDGQFRFNGVYPMLNAALSGAGLAFLPEDLARHHLDAGRLRTVLDDWFPTFPGLHIYFPSRRQSSRALTVVVDALRHRP